MVNEGYRKLYVVQKIDSSDAFAKYIRFVVIFALVHSMIFAFGFMNYHLKANFLLPHQGPLLTGHRII